MRALFFTLVAGLLITDLAAKPATFLQDSFWDDGKAEIAVYEAKRFHYGQLYTSKIEYFFVKESFSKSEMVKTDDYKSKNAIPVIKLNQVISTPTGTYDYQQMHSAFWSRETGQLLKFSMSHHEACGASYKQGVLSPDQTQLQVTGNTYWEGQAQINAQITMNESVWLYDELPFRLRLLLADQAELPAKLKLVPSTIHSKAGSFHPAAATLSRDKNTFTLTHSAGEDILVFDSQWPHVMQSWRQADGESLTLVKSMRLDYWNHHQPGDEKLLE